MTFELKTWPVVPEVDRPRNLYHAGLDPQEAQCLAEHGWNPIDVRLLPSGTTAERRSAILAVLEGIRMGAIVPNPGQVKYLELEARSVGLLTGKAPEEQKETLDADDLATVLDFGRQAV